MSYESTIQNHNAQIQALIDQANALPDAGGGTSVETLRVRISRTGGVFVQPTGTAVASVWNDNEVGQQTLQITDDSLEYFIDNVIKGSLVTLFLNEQMGGVGISGDGSLIMSSPEKTVFCIQVNAVQDEGYDYISLLPYDM